MENRLHEVIETQVLHNSEDVNTWLRTGKWIITDIYHVCPDPENEPKTEAPRYILGKIKS